MAGQIPRLLVHGFESVTGAGLEGVVAGPYGHDTMQWMAFAEGTAAFAEGTAAFAAML